MEEVLPLLEKDDAVLIGPVMADTVLDEVDDDVGAAVDSAGIIRQAMKNGLGH